jgi:flagellar basal-body rod modification protein FlgD
MSVADLINSTSSATSAASAGGAKKKDQLGQTEFLQLMIAQLKNQDPFKALDPTQFLGQLAQFGTVSGIQEMQTAFAQMAESMRASQVLDGATLVGREVLVASAYAALGGEGAIRGAIDVPPDATSVEIRVLDSAGQLVRRIEVPARSGLQDFEWDGTGEDGERLAPGEYMLEATASLGGTTVELETFVADRIQSVTIDARRGLALNTSNLGARTLGEVRRVM